MKILIVILALALSVVLFLAACIYYAAICEDRERRQKKLSFVAIPSEKLVDENRSK